MSTPSLLTTLLARAPSKTVRFPEPPIDTALSEWPALLAAAHRPTAPAPTTPTPSTTQIAALATQIWRARSRLNSPITEQSPEDIRRALRHLDSSLDTFTAMGIVIRDHLQQPYDPGLPVTVITFQPAEGLTRDTIIETIRPSVYWHDRLLQPADVIVGTPI